MEINFDPRTGVSEKAAQWVQMSCLPLALSPRQPHCSPVAQGGNEEAGEELSQVLGGASKGSTRPSFCGPSGRRYQVSPSFPFFFLILDHSYVHSTKL